MEGSYKKRSVTGGLPSSGNLFTHLMLVLAVLLSASIGILLVMRDTGISPFVPGPGGKPPSDAALMSATTGETDEAEQAGNEGTDRTDAGVTEQETETAAADATAGVTDAERKYAEKKAGEETALSITFAEAVLSGRLTGYRILLLEGHDNPEGDIVAEATTDRLGVAAFSVPAGAYTLVWEIPGYVEDYDNLTVGEAGERQEYYRDSATEYVFWKWVLPCMQENGRYVVLEWKGAEDLDLCVFNAGTKEFITVNTPADSDGNFLYHDDDAGSPGMEVIQINDAETSVVYAPYVRDGKSLQCGSYSAMEASGVRVSIYSGSKLLSRQEADRSERAGLWNPCYIYEGNVHQEGSYVYDPGKYMWAAFDKVVY